MLLICLHTGLTHSRRVWKEGEIFDSKKGDRFSQFVDREYSEDMDKEAWEMKQLRHYGKPMFRRLTDTELRDAFGKGLIILEQMTESQKQVISGAIKSKIEEIKVTSESLKKEVAKIEETEVEVVKIKEKKVEEIELLELEEKEEVKPGQTIQKGSESVPVKKKKDK